MNKKVFKILVLFSILVTTITITAFGLRNLEIDTSSDKLWGSTYKLDDKPQPKFKSNKYKAESAFISKEKVLEIIEKKQLKASKSNIESCIRKTWRQHLIEDKIDKIIEAKMIEPDRVVWVILVHYPQGIDTRGGFFHNATVTSAIDAETGTLLETKVTGNRKDNNK